MNILRTLTALLISASVLGAGATGNALWQAEQSCLKYPTPSARAECEKKRKDDMAAFEKERQKKKEEEAKSAGDTSKDAKKKNDLCFKRESTGEIVCPN